MDKNFLQCEVDENFALPESNKINKYLLKNNEQEIKKALKFFVSEKQCLHVHGFLGTGKRQFINYVSDFLNKDAVKLEYYCKQATVCDDIMLTFISILDNLRKFSQINNSKIMALSLKCLQQISVVKKNIVIILHSVDDITSENLQPIKTFLTEVLKYDNVKIIFSTRGMINNIIEADIEKIFLKALTKQIFNEYLTKNNVKVTDAGLENFYQITRGYYYYLALSIKIIQAMNLTLSEFIAKFKESGMDFDSYLGVTYINLIPNTIRNFFWFLRTIRHGLSLNALAEFEIYDEFSIEYLKSNLMIFQADEILYVQDYFMQKIDISIPEKTEIKLHKYIIKIYEKELKESLQSRSFQISRQSMRAEIDYHNECINAIKTKKQPTSEEQTEQPEETQSNLPSNEINTQNSEKTETKNKDTKDLKDIKNLIADKKYTDAIESIRRQLDNTNISSIFVAELRLLLANIYKKIENYTMANNYYDLVELYYKQHNETINLNYLYYEMTDLYHKMYNNDKAIELAKSVIYSSNTHQSLLVNTCILLGNIYADLKDYVQSYDYYKKAIDSLDTNSISDEMLSELYFKYALANDDSGHLPEAFEYYNKCITVGGNNNYRASAYSNLASCYYENKNYDDAKKCFLKAYELEKENNNYDGIYYNSGLLSKICLIENNNKDAEQYLKEAKSSAEFLNVPELIIQSSIELGDFYYNIPAKLKESLTEYLKAQNLMNNVNSENAISVQKRIEDMKLRMKPEDYDLIYDKYNKTN